MPFMQWTETISTGVTQIDDEHKYIITQLNDLYDDITAHKNMNGLLITLETIMAYADMHFDHEETLMRETGYPQYEEHKREHDQVRQKVIDIYNRAKSGNSEAMANELLCLLKGWIRGHLMHVDTAMGPHLAMHGKSDTPIRKSG